MLDYPGRILRWVLNVGGHNLGDIYYSGTVSFGYSPSRDRRIENASLFQLKTWSFFFVLFSYGAIGVLRGHLVICFLPLSLHTTTTLQPCELHLDFVLYCLLLSLFWYIISSCLSLGLVFLLFSHIRQVYDGLSRMSKQSFCVRLTTLFLLDS